jgi:hypothetical protein
MFFVATAPLGERGHINLSPKGLDSFRVLGPQRVAYLDLTGSGVETIAHLKENGRITLMACAFEGERIGAGSAHGDNIAPAVYGGFVLVRVPNPPDVVRLPVPAGLTAVVVHPDLEIETARARALLGASVPLGDAIRQWGNLGAFIDALHRSDFDLMARSLEDAIAEPRRASLVPGLAQIKEAAAATNGDAAPKPTSSAPATAKVMPTTRIAWTRSRPRTIAKASSATPRMPIGNHNQIHLLMSKTVAMVEFWVRP